MSSFIVWLDSPVLATGNNDLTVRRVIRNIMPLDCRLLVCDSRVINIWCLSMAGHFGNYHIITTIERTRLTDIIDTKRFVLPQLCAYKISIKKIKEKTGMTAEFGPAYIRDIPGYLEKIDNGERKVSVGLKERIEMSLECPIILTTLFIFIFNFINFSMMAVITPVIYLLSIFHAMLFPYRPVINILTWPLAVKAVI